jgi:hypothetical protein
MLDQAITGTEQPQQFAKFDAVGWLDRLLAKDSIWHLAVALLFSLQAALILTHSHWLDEWQAMQIAADSPNLAALFENLRYEGHPPLWYFLLQIWDYFLPFHWVLKAVLLPIAAISQALILWRSPFTRGEKLLIASGALMLFEYMTISRSLSLGVMMLVFMMASWKHKRTPWLAIALLPMCDFLFGVLSGIAVLARWRDRSLWWPGVLLWLALGLAAAWSVRPAPDMAAALQLYFFERVYFAAQYIGTMLIPLQAEGLHPQWRTSLPFGFGAIACPLFLWFAYYQTKADKPSMIAFAGFVGLIVLFSLAIYPLEFRHVSLAAFLLILIRWRMLLDGELPDQWFRLWLLAGSVCGLLVSAYALVTPFDRAPEVAKWIEQKGLKNENWLVFPDSRGQGVAAINNMHLERLDKRCRISFVRWNQKKPIETFDELESKIRAYVAEEGGGYMLSHWALDELPKDLAKHIAVFPAGFNGYDYYLFKIGSGVSPKRRAPFCVSSMPAAKP